MRRDSAEVVVVGGGIAGLATAYYLSKEGVRCVVVEPDAIGSHASGFAYGGLSPLGAAHQVQAFNLASFRLHRELAESLPEETGVNTEFRYRPGLELVFDADEAQETHAALKGYQAPEGFAVRWLERAEALELEPRLSPEMAGAVYVEGTADLEPYRFVLALAQAVELSGGAIRHGRATGLRTANGKVEAVVLESGELACGAAVIAMGPWTGQASEWVGWPLKVRPLKGQILRLRMPGPPLRLSISHGPDYATTKPDGLVWAGTTEEEVGFHEAPTPEGRDSIMASLLKMLPSAEEAQLVRQTACLRPLSADRLPVVGAVPGLTGVYVATGGGRSGILQGPAMGRAVADLILRGRTGLDIAALDPARFAD